MKRSFQRSAVSGQLSAFSGHNGLFWIGGYCALPLLFVIVSTLMLSSCSGVQRQPPLEVWDDMKRQDKFYPQTESDLFPDHRASRRPVPGTIARGQLKDDSVFFTGKEGDLYAGKNPLPITMDLLRTGQAKFNTYCSPCHDRAGTGRGIVPLRTPTWLPTNLHDDRIKNTSDGDIFNIVSYGRRSMPSYRFQIVERDRWAIVAYVRALQRASSGTIQDVPPELRADLR